MNLYVDSSAFLKLLLNEPESRTAAELWREAEVLASSRLLYVEARAALAAAGRAHRLAWRAANRSLRELDDLVSRVYLIELRPAVAALAGDLAERNRLRAGDAVHLASAVSLGDGELVVASWDADLRRAVGEVGLAVAP